jgi:small conductance mechanosensitive channel
MQAQDFTLPAAAALPENMKDVLPALTVMLVNGALAFLAATLILVVGWTLSRWVSRWLRDAMTNLHLVDPTLKPLIASMVRYIILAITLVAVMGQFGIQTTSLIALVGAAGLAVGLALQGTLSNVASGVMLLGLRPFRAFDKIKVTDIIGTVDEIGLFRTTLITDDGIYISIPNTSIFAGTISNFSRLKTRRVEFSVDIDHADDINVARTAIVEMLKADTRVLPHPAPDVEVDALNGTATLLLVHAWVANRNFVAIRSELRGKVRHALEAAGMHPPAPLAAVPFPPRPEAASPQADSPR